MEKYRIDAHFVADHQGMIGFIPSKMKLFRPSTFLASTLSGREFITKDEFKAAAAKAMDTKETEELWSSLGELGIIQFQSSEERPAKTYMVTKSILTAMDLLIDGCNLRCIYCYSDSGLFKNRIVPMTLETACRAVDFLDANSRQGETLGLGFEGGEPLLQFDLVREIVEYAKTRLSRSGKDVQFIMATNGTIYSKELSDFLKQHGFKINLSLDGRREVHDRQRPMADGRGSFEKIMQNVKAHRENNVPIYGAVLTVTNSSLDFADEVEAMIDMGFKGVFINFTRSSDERLALRQDDVPIIADQLTRLSKLKTSSLKAVANFNFFINKLQTGVASLYWCPAGREVVAAAGNGKLYYCSSFLGEAGYDMGDIEHGIDIDAINRFYANSIENKPACRVCWARTLCGGGCNHSAYVRNRKIDTPDGIRCQITRKTIEIAMALASDLPKQPAAEKDVIYSHGL